MLLHLRFFTCVRLAFRQFCSCNILKVRSRWRKNSNGFAMAAYCVLMCARSLFFAFMLCFVMLFYSIVFAPVEYPLSAKCLVPAGCSAGNGV